MPVSTTERSSCPDCPLQGNGCYAEQQPLRGVWDEVPDRGMAWEDFCAAIAKLPAGTQWRHNQAGDLPGLGNAIDAGAMLALVNANAGKRGFTYTHKPVLGSHYKANAEIVAAANAAGFTVNLSGNNAAHADELAALEIAPVVTLLPAEYGRKAKGDDWLETLEEYRARTKDLPRRTPEGRAIAPCPATFLDTNCKDCGLCARLRPSVVGFPAHGGGKAKAGAIAAGESV